MFSKRCSMHTIRDRQMQTINCLVTFEDTTLLHIKELWELSYTTWLDQNLNNVIYQKVFLICNNDYMQERMVASVVNKTYTQGFAMLFELLKM